MHARWHGTRPGPYPGAGAGPCRARQEMMRLAIDHHRYHKSHPPINVIDTSFRPVKQALFGRDHQIVKEPSGAKVVFRERAR